MATESRIAVLAALVGNSIIAVLKLTAGLAANSAAMMAEAAHSFSDVGNQVLLFIGLMRGRGGPTPDYPFGTGKSTYFWSFLVAILLFGVAGTYSLLEGAEKVLHPHPVEDITLSLVVLAIAFVVEAGTLTVAYRQTQRAARRRGITSARQFLKENRDATLLTVLVEDSLALVGLPVAALALLLSVWTGNPVWDGVGSIVIGVLLMAFAVFLGSEVHDLLIGRGLPVRDTAKVRTIVTGHPDVQDVVAVQSIHLGPETVLLGVEVDLRDALTADEIERVLRELEAELVAALPLLKYVYIEPRGEEATPPHSASAA